MQATHKQTHYFGWVMIQWFMQQLWQWNTSISTTLLAHVETIQRSVHRDSRKTRWCCVISSWATTTTTTAETSCMWHIVLVPHPFFMISCLLGFNHKPGIWCWCTSCIPPGAPRLCCSRSLPASRRSPWLPSPVCRIACSSFSSTNGTSRKQLPEILWL